MAEEYSQTAAQLTAQIERVRKHLAAFPHDDAAKLKLRILYDIRREMRVCADYLSGYYTRKFAFSKFWRDDDVRSFEIRNAPSHARGLFGLTASDQCAGGEGAAGDLGGIDTDAEKVFDYVSFRNAAD
jgi:ribosomal protein S15P/S13E